MEFKLSYEMWRVGHWEVSVPLVSPKFLSCAVVCVEHNFS